LPCLVPLSSNRISSNDSGQDNKLHLNAYPVIIVLPVWREYLPSAITGAFELFWGQVFTFSTILKIFSTIVMKKTKHFLYRNDSA